MDSNALIVFVDGADGVGKSSVIDAIVKNLFSENLKITTTHLIKHTEVGESFYTNWINGEFSDFNAALIMLGVTCGTLENLEKISSRYDIILVDRSQASFFAYQISNSKNKECLLTAFKETLNNSFYSNCRYINVNMYCDPKVARERMLLSRNSLDAIESKGVEYQKKIIESYQECFNTFEKLSPDLTINTGEIDKHEAGKIVTDYILSFMRLGTK